MNYTELYTKYCHINCSYFESKIVVSRGPPKNNKTNPFCCNSKCYIQIQGIFSKSMWIT